MRRIEQWSAGVDRVCLALAKAGLIINLGKQNGIGDPAASLDAIANSPFSWTEEMARYLMVWSGLLGATCAFRRGLDPVILTVTSSASPLRQRLSQIMLGAAVVLFLLPILHYSVFGPGWNFERGFLWRGMGRSSPGLGLNMALVGAVVPITCLVILIHCAARITAPKILRED